MVSQARPDSSRFQACASCGTTAEAENHTAMPSSSASESRTKVRHFRDTRLKNALTEKKTPAKTEGELELNIRRVPQGPFRSTRRHPGRVRPLSGRLLHGRSSAGCLVGLRL